MSIWVCPHLGIHAPTPHCPEASRGEFVKADPAVPPQPTSVEEVLAHIKGVKHNVGPDPRTYYLAEQSDLDALVAAVRASVLAEVREMVEGIPAFEASQHENAHIQRNPAYVKSDVLAGLAKMEGK